MSVLDHPVDILVLNKTKVKVVIILYLHHGLETDLISFSFSAPKLQICKFRFSFVLGFSVFVFSTAVSFSVLIRFWPIIVFGTVRRGKKTSSPADCKPSRIFCVQPLNGARL